MAELSQPRAESADTVLAVRGLRTQFRTNDGVVKAVRDVSFDVKRGEKVGIVGESGSGKSALALSILGLIEPPGSIAAGEIVLNGRDIQTLGERKLQAVRGKELSLVFQDATSSLNPIMTIGDQITEAILAHSRSGGRRAARRRAIELLREIELPFPERRLNEYPHQYSGGMRQRVMIAIAMANNPDVLIADEPTTALDVTTQAHVLDLLEHLAEHHGTSIVLITHNFGVVAEFCESVLVMYAGRIVEQSSVEDIFVHPAHPYTEALLRSVPGPDLAIDGDLPSIPGLPPNLATVSAGCSFEPRCPVGRGRQACIERPPLPPLSIEAHGRTVIAECHFARERLSELSPAQVDG